MPENKDIYNTPAFQFYPSDFDTDTADWSPEEVGIYIRLLNYQWKHGAIPSDEERLMMIVRLIDKRRFRQAWDVVGAKFPASHDGELKNRRMEEERIKQATYRDKQRENGKKGAGARWHGDANGTANGDPNGTANGDANGDGNGATMALQSSPSSSTSTSPSTSSPSTTTPPYPGDNHSPVLNVDSYGGAADD